MTHLTLKHVSDPSLSLSLSIYIYVCMYVYYTERCFYDAVGSYTCLLRYFVLLLYLFLIPNLNLIISAEVWRKFIISGLNVATKKNFIFISLTHKDELKGENGQLECNVCCIVSTENWKIEKRIRLLIHACILW